MQMKVQGKGGRDAGQKVWFWKGFAGKKTFQREILTLFSGGNI